MTALNFPQNPSNGDEYQDYVYDATNGVWNRKAAQRAYTVSPTKPTNPVEGDVWFSEIDGSSYVYHVDEDSEQWVEIGGSVGAQGNQGAIGPAGETGPQGPAGPGLPEGGAAGQIIVKSSSDDYDTEWSDQVDITPLATTGKAIAMTIVFG